MTKIRRTLYLILGIGPLVIVPFFIQGLGPDSGFIGLIIVFWAIVYYVALGLAILAVSYWRSKHRPNETVAAIEATGQIQKKVRTIFYLMIILFAMLFGIPFMASVLLR